MIGEDTLRALLPGWMSTLDHWTRYMRAVVGRIDTMVDEIRLARLAAMPGQIDAIDLGGFESVDALAVVGRDRRLTRGKLETDVAYAARLRDWLTAKRLAGTHAGLIHGIRAVLAPTPPQVALVLGGADATGGRWWFLNDTGLLFQNSDGTGLFWPADGSAPSADATVTREWDWDSGYWPTAENPDPSRIWVIITAPSCPPELSGGDGTWDDGLSVFGEKNGDGDKLTIGTTASLPFVDVVRSVCADLKPAGVKVEKIIIAFEAIDNQEADPPGDGTLPDGWWKWHGKVVADGATARWQRARTAANRYWTGTV